MRLDVGIISFNAAIAVCAEHGRWYHALDILNSMKDTHAIPDHISYHSSIRACDKASRWELAFTVLNRMKLDKLSPNVVC